MNLLSKERSREKLVPSTVQRAHDAVRQAEEDMGECEEAAEILKILRGYAVTSTELVRAIASEGKGLAFVDWFTADIPGVPRALHI